METSCLNSEAISELLATHRPVCWYRHVDPAFGQASAAPARGGEPAAEKEV